MVIAVEDSLKGSVFIAYNIELFGDIGLQVDVSHKHEMLVPVIRLGSDSLHIIGIPDLVWFFRGSTAAPVLRLCHHCQAADHPSVSECLRQFLANN